MQESPKLPVALILACEKEEERVGRYGGKDEGG